MVNTKIPFTDTRTVTDTYYECFCFCAHFQRRILFLEEAHLLANSCEPTVDCGTTVQPYQSDVFCDIPHFQFWPLLLKTSSQADQKQHSIMRKRAVRDRHPSEVTRKENDKIHHRTQKSHSSIYCLNRLGRNIRPVLPLVSKVLAIVLLLFCLWKILPDLPAVHPRIIQINDRYILQPESIEEITYRTVEPLLQGEIGRYSRHQFDKGDCKAMHQWQDEYIPVCNPFHEIDMYDSTYLASGFWRNVWRMRDGDGSLAAIKTLAWNRNFTLFDQNNHMKDAIAYSVLQSSEFIPNIYGYCK